MYLVKTFLTWNGKRITTKEALPGSKIQQLPGELNWLPSLAVQSITKTAAKAPTLKEH